MLWSGLVLRVGTSHKVNPIAPLISPLDKIVQEKLLCLCISMSRLRLISLSSDESHLSRHLLHFVGLSILGVFVLEVSLCGVF